MVTASAPLDPAAERDAAFCNFLDRYPSYARTSILDDLRTTDYGRLDRLGEVYLDYTGGALYPESILQRHLDLLRQNVFGNPHSTNPTSMAMTRLVEQARTFVLEYFHDSSAEYEVVFTSNATGALKLLCEAYPFTAGGRLLLTGDNHNSVNGIREFARAKGAVVTYVPLSKSSLRIAEPTLRDALNRPASRLFRLFGHARARSPKLFAYPAQSNFTGVQHPLTWIEEAQTAGWDVLLDAAAFVPTNRLDLSRWHPDYVALSFYKMCCYPTGIGCLLVRKPALAKLRRPWYAGGTIVFSSVAAANHPGDGFYLKPGPEGFEDGTVNYLTIPAVEIGLRYLATIGIETVHERVACLTGWLLEQLAALRHTNGARLVRIYGPTGTALRGGTIAMNFADPAGCRIDEYVVEAQAHRWNISLRAGCHCNPGAREAALYYSTHRLARCFREKKHQSYEAFVQGIAEQRTGVVRLSLGLAANFADVARFLQFARSFLNRSEDEWGMPTGRLSPDRRA
jgi:selenocysteine lyase/cysteine desulfurase